MHSKISIREAMDLSIALSERLPDNAERSLQGAPERLFSAKERSVTYV
jgi:hypothetical protein